MQDAINATTDKFDCLWRSDESLWVIFDDFFRESANTNIRDLHCDLLVMRVRACHISSLSCCLIPSSLAVLFDVGRGNACKYVSSPWPFSSSRKLGLLRRQFQRYIALHRQRQLRATMRTLRRFHPLVMLRQPVLLICFLFAVIISSPRHPQRISLSLPPLSPDSLRCNPRHHSPSRSPAPPPPRPAPFWSPVQ